MIDPIESRRRARLAEIHAHPGGRPELEALHGQVWNSEQLARDFEVLGFLAPYVVVRRRGDDVIGSLEFPAAAAFLFSFPAR